MYSSLHLPHIHIELPLSEMNIKITRFQKVFFSKPGMSDNIHVCPSIIAVN